MKLLASNMLQECVNCESVYEIFWSNLNMISINFKISKMQQMMNPYT